MSVGIREPNSSQKKTSLRESLAKDFHEGDAASTTDEERIVSFEYELVGFEKDILEVLSQRLCVHTIAKVEIG